MMSDEKNKNNFLIISLLFYCLSLFNSSPKLKSILHFIYLATKTINNPPKLQKLPCHI